MSAFYWSESKGCYVEIETMAYPHIKNALAKLEAGQNPSGMNDEQTIEALRAEIAKRDAQEGPSVPPPAEPEWDPES